MPLCSQRGYKSFAVFLGFLFLLLEGSRAFWYAAGAAAVTEDVDVPPDLRVDGSRLSLRKKSGCVLISG